LVPGGPEVFLGNKNFGHARTQSPCPRQKTLRVNTIADEGLFETGNSLSIDTAAMLRGAILKPLVQLLGNILDRQRRHL
jgi:hypothetical protein